MSTTQKDSDFKLTFEVTIIEHLGLNLYSEVHSALSELIANSYDAEAKKVDVTLPIGVELGHPGQTIVVADSGHGMTYKECRDKYLRLGRNRRRRSRTSKNGLRKVIGKKGIGKLAGFGIASELHVRTVANGKLTEFSLDLEDIRRAEPVDEKEAEEKGEDAADVSRTYYPDILHKGEQVSESDGTVVTLKNLRNLDAIDWDEFMNHLSRKFAVFGDEFSVVVHKAGSDKKREVKKFDVECQFRFPDEGWGEEEIDTPSGEQTVKYWVGFTKGTIKEDAKSGISVIANGKSVQEPFEFRLSGGVEGQFGLQYMTGEVKADWLDEKAVDVIASDRSSVRWSNPDAKKLLEWGREKIKSLLKEWVKLRAEDSVKEVTERDPKIQSEIESYQGEARAELERVIDRVASTISYVSAERMKEVVGSIVMSYRHEHIRKVLQKITEAQGGIQMFGRALAEWDLIEAVLTFRDLAGKYMALETLRTLILGKATEVKPSSGDLSLHEHLADHPWLIDPMFSEVESERNIDKYILEKYGEDPKQDDKRFDFVVVYDSGRVRVIEIKSAKAPIDKRGLNNLMDYHHRVKEAERMRGKGREVRTQLIYNGEHVSSAAGLLDTVRGHSEYDVFTWTELLDRNSTIYKEQLRRVQRKNPDDPRIESIRKTMLERVSQAEDMKVTEAAETNGQSS